MAKVTIVIEDSKNESGGRTLNLKVARITGLPKDKKKSPAVFLMRHYFREFASEKTLARIMSKMREA
jgi:hypothetical protein